jgi:hypothetical protein
MSRITKSKSGTQRDILAPYAIMARKEAEHRAKKTQTLGPLHKELSAKLFEQSTKKYQKNQPLIAKVEVIDPAKIFKKRIVKTNAPRYGEEKLDVLGSEQIQQARKDIIKSLGGTLTGDLRVTPRFKEQGKGPLVRNESPLAVSQAAPGRTRRTPNLGGKKKRRRTRKKRKRRRTREKRKHRKTHRKRKYKRKRRRTNKK